VIAGYVTWRLPVRLKDIADDPLAYFRPPPPGEPPPGEPPAEAADDQPTDQPVD
jgi:hypothetical protein